MTNNQAKLKQKLNLNNLIWQSICMQAICLIIFLISESYITFLNSTQSIKNEIENELTKQREFFANELYLNQTNALSSRVEFIANEFTRQHTSLKLCIELFSLENGKNRISFFCNGSINKLKNSAPDGTVAIKFGGKEIGQLIYVAHLPYNALQTLPVSFILAILFSTVLVLILQLNLVRKIKDVVIIPIFKLIKKNARALGIAETASQVAHDIRSPLAALDVATKDNIYMTEEQRILIRNAIERIRNIADNLLSTYRNISEKKETTVDLSFESVIISDCLLSVVSEKKALYKKSNIELQVNINNDAYILCSKINQHQFKRVLSNLLNNAFEAIDNKGVVAIKLYHNDRYIFLKINDSGCGIPENLIPKIMTDGISYGKNGGSGLGLSSAIKLLRSWHGDLTIQSKPQQGTSLEIKLLKTTPPIWLAPLIHIPKYNRIVIVDDDQMIHDVWQQRFIQMAVEDIKVMNFRDPDDFMAWKRTYHQKNVLYLIDYEFVKSSLNGVKIIEELNIINNSILVTSRHESTAIIDYCKSIKLKIIPKNIAAYIPIHTNLSCPQDQLNRREFL